MVQDGIRRFDDLHHKTQMLIDCAIFLDEMQGGQLHPNTELPNDFDRRIAVLREFFAEDIQRKEPVYYRWRGREKQLIAKAIKLQDEIMKGEKNLGIGELYIEQLDLPYPGAFTRQVSEHNPKARER